MALRKDFNTLKQHILADNALSSHIKLQNVDGGSVCVDITRDARLSCTIFFSNEDDYPHSPLMAMCEGDDGVNSALESFGEEFEYGASLLDVIIRLCDTLGLESSSLHKVKDGSASEADEEVDSVDEASDNGQDMAETDNQVCLQRAFARCATNQKSYGCLHCDRSSSPVY